ncbi:MAG: hypothetical protein QOF61_2893, partial [Acidobacteriota bacterium]|nr:hypothetical protein [Acidobacteriota bacterium]
MTKTSASRVLLVALLFALACREAPRPVASQNSTAGADQSTTGSASPGATQGTSQGATQTGTKFR